MASGTDCEVLEDKTDDDEEDEEVYFDVAMEQPKDEGRMSPTLGLHTPTTTQDKLLAALEDDQETDCSTDLDTEDEQTEADDSSLEVVIEEQEELVYIDSAGRDIFNCTTDEDEDETDDESDGVVVLGSTAR